MNIKRLVLGTAAGALAVTGAQAADLPVVVEPVDYVRICDAVGTGYFFIPGTDTCMNISTRVRTDYNLYFDIDDANVTGLLDSYDGDIGDRLYRFRARGYVRTSTVTQTEFGQLRTFVDIFVTKDSGARFSGEAGDAVTLDSALIQLGGLFLGRFATSFGGSQGIYTIEQTFDLGNNTGQVNQIAYQFDFGNGFTATVALEDTTKHRDGIVALALGPNFVFLPTFSDYGGAQVPDIVAKVEVVQGWGSARLSAAGHYVNAQAFYSNGVVLQQRSDTDYGFAVGAGVEANLPFGNGTKIGVQGGYAYGALDYIADSPTGIGAADGLFDNAGNLQLGNFFSVAGGVTTSFTPTVSAALGAGWVYMDHDFDPADTTNINVQGTVGWEPISGMLFALGAEYRYQDDDVLGDASALTTFFRAQATF
ncbi:MAG: porin [Pseudomonadota bacterium]